LHMHGHGFLAKNIVLWCLLGFLSKQPINIVASNLWS
jgi:hypothetical protein